MWHMLLKIKIKITQLNKQTNKRNKTGKKKKIKRTSSLSLRSASSLSSFMAAPFFFIFYGGFLLLRNREPWTISLKLLPLSLSCNLAGSVVAELYFDGPGSAMRGFLWCSMRIYERRKCVGLFVRYLQRSWHDFQRVVLQMVELAVATGSCYVVFSI